LNRVVRPRNFSIRSFSSAVLASNPLTARTRVSRVAASATSQYAAVFGNARTAMCDGRIPDPSSTSRSAAGSDAWVPTNCSTVGQSRS